MSLTCFRFKLKHDQDSSTLAGKWRSYVINCTLLYFTNMSLNQLTKAEFTWFQQQQKHGIYM